MTKTQKRLAVELQQRFGVDGEAIAEFLYKSRITDDALVRRHLIGQEYVHRLTTTTLSSHQIESDIGEDYGVSRWCVRDAVKSLA